VSCFEKISANERPYQIMQPTEAELIQAEESSGVTARDGARRFPQSSREPPRFKSGTPPVFIAATDTPTAACTSRARASDSYVRHGAERLDLSVTFLVGSVRSGDERSAHLRTVPAR